MLLHVELLFFAERILTQVAGAIGTGASLREYTLHECARRHQRRNQYEADVTVQVLDAGWRITGLELLNEVRF